jgi:hypothetical protein
VFEIPGNLHPDCISLAWLLGTWEGTGEVVYPTIETRSFKQRVEFSQNGKPFLYYLSRSWEIDPDGKVLGPLNMETGFWRPRPADQAEGEEAIPIEVLLSHPTGFLEAMLGEIRGPRVEIATSKVIKVESAKDYRRGHRLYGHIPAGAAMSPYPPLPVSQLMWVYEMEAMGQPLQPHISAALSRVPTD